MWRSTDRYDLFEKKAINASHMESPGRRLENCMALCLADSLGDIGTVNEKDTYKQ